eukprot:g19718.t1
MNPFFVLGLPFSADKHDIRRKFKLLAVQKHPDKGGSKEEFQRLLHAYEQLQDDNCRQRWAKKGRQDATAAAPRGGSTGRDDQKCGGYGTTSSEDEEDYGSTFHFFNAAAGVASAVDKTPPGSPTLANAPMFGLYGGDERREASLVRAFLRSARMGMWSAPAPRTYVKLQLKEELRVNEWLRCMHAFGVLPYIFAVPAADKKNEAPSTPRNLLTSHENKEKGKVLALPGGAEYLCGVASVGGAWQIAITFHHWDLETKQDEATRRVIMSAQGQAAPAASAGGATGAAAAAAQRPKATKEAAQEFHQMCLVRQVQQSFETVREQAKANNVDLGEQLQNMGYARFEDFILKCEKFSFFCDPMDFAELGAGMVLYFDFLKYLMCLALFFFVLYTPAMLLVVGGAEDSPYLLNSWTKMPSWVTEAETTAAVAAAGLPGYAALLNARGSQKALIDTGYSAIGNVGKPGSPIDTLWQAASPGNDAMGMDKPWVIYLYLVSLFAAMASVGLYGVRQRAIDDKVDATAIHPNDYAIFVRNLPVEEGEEENIRAYFEQNALEGGQLADIAKVVIAWDITEFKKITDKQAAIGKSYFKLLKSGVDATDERALSIKEEFKAATEELKKLKSGENLQGSGIAIVVFASQRQQRDCLDKWESSIWMSFAHFLGENFELHCLESFCAWMNGTPLYGGRGGRLLKVQRAPNPTDVNWSDLGHGKIEIILKQMQLYAAMGVLIGICFLLTYLLQRWSDDMDSEGGGSNGASVVPALVVAVLNGALMWASRNFTQYEYHETKTSEDGSTTKKMTAAMIINTAIIQFLVYAEDEKWFVENGLVVQMFFMVMIHSFLLPWFTLFDLPFFIKQMTVRKINWATNKIPQEKVNNLFTPSELDLPRRYAVALKLFITSLLVMPLFPWCLPICCTGLMLQYAVDKYMLVNSFARPKFTKDSDNAFDRAERPDGN